MSSESAVLLDCTKAVEGNPDISGVGVRISFYLQLALLVFLVDRSWEDAPAALWTFISTSFGLTLAAIVQWKQNELSFLQALQVSNLVWLANIGSWLALASYSRKGRLEQDKADKFVKWAAMAQTILSMVMTLLMWTYINTFFGGPDQDTDQNEQCAELIRYVVLFAVGLPVLTTGKTVGITVTSLLTGIYLLISAHEVFSHSKARNKQVRTSDIEQAPPFSPRTRDRDDIPMAAISRKPSKFSATLNIPPSSPNPSVRSRSDSASDRPSLDAEAVAKRAKRRRWFVDTSPMLVGVTAAQVAISIYFIASSEMMLIRNKSVDSVREWGFGQILAMVITLPSLLAVVNAFKANGLKAHKKKKKRRGGGLGGRRHHQRARSDTPSIDVTPP